MLTYPGGGFNRVTETMAPTGTHQKHADPEIERLSREVEKLTALCETLLEKIASKSESGHSTKLPDPERFDASPVYFPGWISNIRLKLTYDADHFHSDQHRMAYVYSRLTQNAQFHMVRHTNEQGFEFDTIEDMLTCLSHKFGK